MGTATFQPISTLTEEHDRRRNDRLTSDYPVPINLVSDSLVSFRALTQDASSMGVGLVSDRPFEIGTQFAVSLQDPSELFSACLTAQVIHVEPIAGDKFLLGCSLSRMLTDREMSILLGNRR